MSDTRGFQRRHVVLYRDGGAWLGRGWRGRPMAEWARQGDGRGWRARRYNSQDWHEFKSATALRDWVWEQALGDEAP